ncbi:carbohydrate-binding protein [Desulfoscipio geothermicus]|uniref:Starch/carbohydrate-binding module (Family 53) n=1 Tax=Desulfoscipio geothermicus DSM 3669 TaxID=1121426 RepID=A0A1I6DM48_9FIRM|nr:carbohydrate-binding protein [Desulfoscipio geothermicus]SFR06499.1 Starch/carbohydrate-binding module (family 53) [Desulfoscipio geothermicus DSM 3669]
MSTLSPFTFSAPIQGVQVKPLTQDGKQIRIRYNGLLNQSGAEQIFLHGGFGEDKEWQEVKDYLMEKTSEGWEQTIDIQDRQFNFCFRDNAHNWDNNNGVNWIYRIT